MNIFTSNFGIRGLDITARSKHVFSPTWTMVRRYKDGTISKTQYKKLYLHLLEKRKKRIDEWVDNQGLTESRTFCCFCPPGAFCHRVLAAKWLEKNYKKITYVGEI